MPPVPRCIKSTIGTGHQSIPVRALATSNSCNSEGGGLCPGATPKSKLCVFKLLAHLLDRCRRTFLVRMGDHYEKFLASKRAQMSDMS